MKASPVIVERSLNASPGRIWKALTDRNEIRQWYFNLADFKPEVGFEFSFEGGPDGRVYVHRCKVTEVMPGSKLSYSWRYEGYEGNSVVSFELFPMGAQTLVRLTHAGLETFPADNKDFAEENFMAGWTEIIGTLLKNYVEK